MRRITLVQDHQPFTGGRKEKTASVIAHHLCAIAQKKACLRICALSRSVGRPGFNNLRYLAIDPYYFENA
ncbi:hypothetical protein [Novosphingobium sp. UBA1939]|uniref:hypothetical protein n=1 Tax=Novosphingobium sp. UBA1939 TaxID=1946982 RepID=UPI0025EF25A3|nr:hypothetical protein [Novosphingobium sp. UBA1939]